jgi:acetylornithine deacetylase/succinyl-diaminopimelate desuccinylase-like protein
VTSLEQLLKLADEAHEEAVALTQRLVQVPSVNTGKHNEPPWPPTGKPAPGEPYGEPLVPYDASSETPTGDELPAAELVRDTLAAAGIDSTLYYSSARRANVVANLGVPGGQPRLLFMSHIDVVPVEDAA